MLWGSKSLDVLWVSDCISAGEKRSEYVLLQPLWAGIMAVSPLLISTKIP